MHEWSGVFQGQSVWFKMTSVCGHVMSLDFPGKFNNWDRVDPVSMFFFLLLQLGGVIHKEFACDRQIATIQMFKDDRRGHLMTTLSG